jgi:hypothetical protein
MGDLDLLGRGARVLGAAVLVVVVLIVVVVVTGAAVGLAVGGTYLGSYTTLPYTSTLGMVGMKAGALDAGVVAGGASVVVDVELGGGGGGEELLTGRLCSGEPGEFSRSAGCSSFISSSKDMKLSRNETSPLLFC